MHAAHGQLASSIILAVKENTCNIEAARHQCTLSIPLGVSHSWVAFTECVITELEEGFSDLPDNVEKVLSHALAQYM